MSVELNPVLTGRVPSERGENLDSAAMTQVAAQAEAVATPTIAASQNNPPTTTLEERIDIRSNDPLLSDQPSSDGETVSKCARVRPSGLGCTILVYIGLLALCVTLVVLDKNGKL